MVLYMALDLYHAPGWLWGVMGTLMSVLWIGWGGAHIAWARKALELSERESA